MGGVLRLARGFFLVDECIDCGACVPGSPVRAIFALEDLPEKRANFIRINADYFKTPVG